MAYYDILAISGIILEIWGFIWVLQYFRRSPPEASLMKWHEKYSPEVGRFEETPEHIEIIHMRMEPDKEKESKGEMPTITVRSVDKRFYNFWFTRETWSIRLVVFGLILQGIQVTFSFFIQS